MRDCIRMEVSCVHNYSLPLSLASFKGPGLHQHLWEGNPGSSCPLSIRAKRQYLHSLSRWPLQSLLLYKAHCLCFSAARWLRALQSLGDFMASPPSAQMPVGLGSNPAQVFPQLIKVRNLHPQAPAMCSPCIVSVSPHRLPSSQFLAPCTSGWQKHIYTQKALSAQLESAYQVPPPVFWKGSLILPRGTSPFPLSILIVGLTLPQPQMPM